MMNTIKCKQTCQSLAAPTERFAAEHFAADPLANVPEKFKAVWLKLPGCCRAFYLSPGKGCCAGLPEPQPNLMKDLEDKVAEPAVKKVVPDQSLPTISVNPVQKTSPIVIEVLKGFYQDIHRLFFLPN
jgi:hypothetical protein